MRMSWALNDWKAVSNGNVGWYSTTPDWDDVEADFGATPSIHAKSHLCGTTKPDTAHIFHELYGCDVHWERQRIWALNNCSTTRIIMAPIHHRWLGLPSAPTHITILGHNCQVMRSAKDCQKTTVPCQYFEPLAPVDEPEHLVVPVMAYDLVPGLCWFQSWPPEMDRSKGQLLSLQMPVGNSGNERTITSLDQGDASVEDGACEPSPPAIDIWFLGATAFDDWHACNEISSALAIWIDRGTGLQGASTMSEVEMSEQLSVTSPSQCFMGKLGVAAVVAPEGGRHRTPEWLLTAHQDMKGGPEWWGLALLRWTIRIHPSATLMLLQPCENRVTSRG